MLSQQLPPSKNESSDYFNLSVSTKIDLIKIDWTESQNEFKIQSYLVIDEIAYALKHIGLKYLKNISSFTGSCNQYSKINTIVHHAIIEFENENYDDSIKILNYITQLLITHKKVESIFYSLIHLLLTFNYYCKKERNQAEYFLDKFNKTIETIIDNGVEVNPDLFVKINSLLNNKIDTENSNPFLTKTLKGRDLEFVNKLIDLIDNNLDNEELCVSLLSKELFLSPSQIYRKLHALTDYTVVKLIRLVKLDRAKKMLQEKTTNVSGVANKIAYSASHFTRVFTKEYGISPREFLISA